MKHNQFKSWILNDELLQSEQKRALKAHLETCTHCKKFYFAWQAIMQLINNLSLQFPSPGFSQRWKNTLIIRQKQEQARHIRNTLTLLTVVATLGSLLYILSNNLILNWLAAGLSAIIKFFVIITKGLSELSQLFYQKPTITISAGIIIFGIMVAFLTVIIFIAWYWLSKVYRAYEFIIKD